MEINYNFETGSTNLRLDSVEAELTRDIANLNGEILQYIYKSARQYLCEARLTSTRRQDGNDDKFKSEWLQLYHQSCLGKSVSCLSELTGLEYECLWSELCETLALKYEVQVCKLYDGLLSPRYVAPHEWSAVRPALIGMCDRYEIDYDVVLWAVPREIKF